MSLRKRFAFVVMYFLLFALAPLALAQTCVPPPAANPNAVPTFHSIGLYWGNVGGPTVRGAVRFRESNGAWRQGLDLWFDERNSEYRGSIVELRPGTAYEIELTAGTSTRNLQVSTWCESHEGRYHVPSADEVEVPQGTTRIVIRPVDGPGPHTTSFANNTFTVNAPRDSGGFTRISAPSTPAGRNHVSNTSGACIDIRNGTRNVIITGLVIRDCGSVGVNFDSGGGNANPTENIIIEKNEFYGWGSFNATLSVPEFDAAISCKYGGSASKPQRIIIQANIFRDPRHRSTHWDQFPAVANGHPQGALATWLGECGGNHVFRYNEVYATEAGNTTKYFMDGIGGCCNEEVGTPGPDSDIYGNRISHVFDDAIQAEGENRNVRIWGNYVDRTFVAIANVPVRTGPLYVWRNISNNMASMRNPNIDSDSDSDRRKQFVKGGDDDTGESGRAYYFHNTILQPPPPQNKTHTLGAGYGLEQVDGRLINFVSKNNIWHIHRPDFVTSDDNYASLRGDCNSEFCDSDFDLYNADIDEAGPTTRPGGESWSGRATPTYASSGTSYPDVTGQPGDFSLAAGSAGHGQALRLNNFNDQYTNPDIGAHQSGTSAMKFGLAAAGSSDPGGVVGPTAALGTLSPATGPAPLTVQFSVTGTQQGSAPIESLRLDFGDGSHTILAGTNETPSHQYAFRATPYTATLTVTAEDGRTDEAHVSIVTTCGANAPTAVLRASPTSGASPLPVNFDASESRAVSPATIQTYTVDYGDDTPSGSGVTQSHTYTSAGQRTASLIVTDSNGCQSAPSTQLITITGGGPSTVKLQQGFGGYAGATDTKIASAFPSTNFGTEGNMDVRMETSASVLARFAIFASEGGPVPNNATITAATLSFYKHSGAEATMKVSRLLKNWTESGATWQVTGAGSNWTTAGARSAGSDYLATPDAQAFVSNASGCSGQDGGPTCWINFDVTAGVQAFRNGTPNYGWKLAYVSGPLEPPKWINSRDNSAWPALRPKLEITYTVPTGNAVTLQQGLNGYAGATDNKIASAFPSTNFGTEGNMDVRMESSASVLARFAIFASEGGPVPDNATITLATLSFYKRDGAEATMKVSRLLKNWTETGATWQVTGAGSNWTTAGARSAGSDYLATPDAQAFVSSASGCSGQDGGPTCWINFDVTAGVQAFKDGAPNYGWKLAYVSGPLEPPKWFYAREIPGWPTLRPRLLIEYTQ